MFIQIMSPKLEDTVAVLEAVKGKERSWTEFAKESGINPSTVSRVINGKQKNPLTIKTLEKLEKFTVDVLGEYHKVEREPRMTFNRK